MADDKRAFEGVAQLHNNGSTTPWWKLRGPDGGVSCDGDWFRGLKEGDIVRLTVERVPDAVTDEEEPEPLEEQLVARLREWFKRTAPLTKEWRTPQITFRLDEPQGDDDGALYLDASVEETAHEALEGRVPGERL